MRTFRVVVCPLADPDNRNVHYVNATFMLEAAMMVVELTDKTQPMHLFVLNEETSGCARWSYVPGADTVFPV